jgi:hypothetical protein
MIWWDILNFVSAMYLAIVYQSRNYYSVPLTLAAIKDCKDS